MTKDELAERLVRLDPGKRLTIEVAELAPLFGSDQLTADVIQVVEAFAIDHRCIFSCSGHEQAVPCFEKEDTF